MKSSRKNIFSEFIVKQKFSKHRNVRRFLTVIFILMSFCFISGVQFSQYFFARTERIWHVTSISDYDLPHVFNIQNYVHDEIRSSYQHSIAKKQRVPDNEIPNSISGFYSRFGYEICGNDVHTPFVPALRSAFIAYGFSLKTDSDVNLAMQNTTITVQLAGEPDKMSDEFVSEVKQKAFGYSDLFLVSSCSPRLSTGILSMAAVESVIRTLRKKIQKMIPNVHVHTFNCYIHPDKSAYILSVATHLFAHGGSDGALAALSNSIGTVRTSSDLDEYMKNNQFKWMLSYGKPMDVENLTRSQVKFRAMGPIYPSCCNFQGFGRGDQEKIVCVNAKDFRRAPCWILSLGCNNKWLFEEDIFSKTSCITHVFDCTGKFQVPKRISGRVFLHNYCVGPPLVNDTNFMTLAEIIEYGSKLSGFSGPVAPTIAKIDIEGWEIPSLRPLLSNKSLEYLLPHQILMEFHVSSSKAFRGIPNTLRRKGKRYEKPEMLFREFFKNLSTAGYDLVHRADNPFCEPCSEINLLLRSKSPQLWIS